jgi:hypothetical protein
MIEVGRRSLAWIAEGSHQRAGRQARQSSPARVADKLSLVKRIIVL